MYLIDSHTHVYLPEFDSDRGEMIGRATNAGVKTLIMPAIDASTHEAMIGLASKFDQCHAMMGLHPCSVNQDFEKEIAIVKNYLQAKKFLAVGEIGLDFYWDKTFADQQYFAFHQQIEIALEYELPIAIHSRNATDECISVIQQYPNLKGVFHCFSGDHDQAIKIIEAGFLLGIGGVVSFKNAGLDKVVERIGLANVILETDAPYLAPVPFRGKRNEPAYISIIAQKLADLCHCSLEEVAAITSENAKNLFRL